MHELDLAENGLLTDKTLGPVDFGGYCLRVMLSVVMLVEHIKNIYNTSLAFRVTENSQ